MGSADGMIASEPRTSIVGDRRVITAVFIDVVGSTSLSFEIDDEDYLAVMHDYRDIATELAETFGGYIAKDEGDGRFIWFGFPRARIDDAKRAVEMAEQVVARVAESASGLTGEASPIAVRVGMHTGHTPITFREGEESPDALSATVNLAAKVQAQAEPGTIVITESTAAALMGAYELESVGPLSVSGSNVEIELRRIVRRSDRMSTQPALVGRTDQLTALGTAWAAARRGDASSVGLVGPAGRGKSRLIDAFQSSLGPSADAATVVRIQGEEAKADSPFSSLLDTLISVEPTERGGPAKTSPDALVEAVAAITATGPAVLIIDDVQWLDPSTLDAVHRVIAASFDGLLVIIAGRSIDKSTSDLLDEIVSLNPLRPSAAVELVDALRPDLADSTRAQIVERAEGNPFFLVWLARSATSYAPGASRILLSRSGVPAVIQQAVQSQLDTHGVDQSTTTTAATIGMDFTADLIASALIADPAEIEAHLRRLVDNGVVLVRSGGRYRFAHAIIRQMAYDLMLAPDRTTSHRLVADALLRDAGADDAVIGNHRSNSGQHQLAAQHWLAAAREYRKTSRFVEGANLAARVLSACETYDLGPELTIEATELQAMFAGAVDPGSYMGGTSQHVGLDALLDPDSDPRRRAMAHIRDWAGAMVAGQMASAISLNYTIHQQIGNQHPEIEVFNRGLRGTWSAYRGRWAHAEHTLGESVNRLEQEGVDPWLLENWAVPDDGLALLQVYLVQVMFERGRLQDAHAVLHRAQRRAETMPGSAQTMAHVASYAALFHLSRRDTAATVDAAKVCIDIGSELDLEFWQFIGGIYTSLGQAIAAPSSDVLDALTPQAEVVAQFTPIIGPRVFETLASIALEIGDSRRAGAYLGRATDVARNTGILASEAETSRLWARVEPDRSGHHLERSLQIAQRQGALRSGLRALTDMATDSTTSLGTGHVASALEASIASMSDRDIDPDVRAGQSALESMRSACPDG